MAPILNFSGLSENVTDKTPNTPLALSSTVQAPTDKTLDCLGFVTDKTPLSASWVLADLFDVTALELLIPDHVLENEPGLELIPCPECGGEGWLECYGSAWSASCEAWGRPDLNFTLKPCSRCHCEGEVLGLSVPAPP